MAGTNLWSELYRTIESLDWRICEIDDDVELSQGSPAGEDFSFCVAAKTPQEMVDEVVRYAEAFDVEEHVHMWLDAKTENVAGVPDLTTLLKDAEDIQAMLSALAATVKSKWQKLRHPVAKIGYLGCHGDVAETLYFYSADDLKKAVRDGNVCGVPMTITIFADSDGNKIDSSFVDKCDPPICAVVKRLAEEVFV